MNEELVEKRLSDLESKIDKVLEIVTQTQLQEYRIKSLEKEIDDIKNNKKVWIAPIISAVVSAIISWIISGGLK